MMHRLVILLMFISGFSGNVFPQQEPDSLPAKDILRKLVPVVIPDSITKDSVNISAAIDSPDSLQAVPDSLPMADTTKAVQILSHPEPEPRKEGEPKFFSGKETLFYVILLFLVAFALMRMIFSKYFTDLARIFFRRTIKQRQVYELLVQSPLPSVLLNLYFVLSGGLYLSFLLVYLDGMIADDFWLQFLYCAAALAAIYIVKSGSLRIIGWIFNIKNVISDYSFIVFMINKAIGVLLLPCIILIAFSPPEITKAAFYFSWAGLVLLFLYRMVLSFGIVRNQVKVNLFHFIIYVVAFEFIPLMLIYKWLLHFF